MQIAQPVSELKLSLDELHKRRRLIPVPGAHWDYVKKRVLLSTTGAVLLRAVRNAILPNTE